MFLLEYECRFECDASGTIEFRDHTLLDQVVVQLLSSLLIHRVDKQLCALPFDPSYTRFPFSCPFNLSPESLPHSIYSIHQSIFLDDFINDLELQQSEVVTAMG